ncbi:MAG: DNA mismatch repair endonuclease MutL [Deltaproteobacteria bacterium]|nr:DNA mismatch repair endonuclease MutL [Deltaproteobacteria bacterium]
MEARSSRIVRLHADVVEQIAAGEVVDRPAAVVKELVENAVDAGARRIEVELHGGGQSLIRVTDDGCGMSAAELELSVERHATSKLRRLSDLQELRTLGFRGEGLSSVAAVSRLTLVSRQAGSEAGSRLQVEGGRLMETGPAGCAIGTRVEVRELFFNTPARRKFLKSSTTEVALVGELLGSLACAAPGVRFGWRPEGRAGFDLPGSESRLERAQALLGQRGGRLRGGVVEEQGLRVEVCLSAATQSLGSPRGLMLLVNGRPVRDRPLLQAVLAGYGELLPRGRYPVGVVHVDVPPELVDVNVHPQKFEVRFADAAAVYRLIRRCALELVSGAPSRAEEPPARVYRLTDEGAAAAERGDARRLAAAARFWSAQRRPPGVAEGLEKQVGREVWAGLRVIGRAGTRLLVCEAGGELVLLDLRRLRGVLFEAQLKEELARPTSPGRALDPPRSLTLDEGQGALLRRRVALLERLGFALEPFGGEGWVLRAVPRPLAELDPERIFEVALEELARLGERPTGLADGPERLCALLARRAARLETRLPTPHDLLAELREMGLSFEELAAELHAARAHGARDLPGVRLRLEALFEEDEG